MSRKKVRPIKQPDEVTCGPASLKIALKILGKRVSLRRLIDLCNTTQNGTSTRDMLKAIKKLGLSALMIEEANLNHVISSLKLNKTILRASIVSYLYDTDDDDNPDIDSSHWAVVASFSSARNRIVLFDSYSGKRKSYNWKDFKRRWLDYEIKRKNIRSAEKSYRFVKKWQPKPLLVIARDSESLPKFSAKKMQYIEG